MPYPAMIAYAQRRFAIIKNRAVIIGYGMPVGQKYFNSVGEHAVAPDIQLDIRQIRVNDDAVHGRSVADLDFLIVGKTHAYGKVANPAAHFRNFMDEPVGLYISNVIIAPVYDYAALFIKRVGIRDFYYIIVSNNRDTQVFNGARDAPPRDYNPVIFADDMIIRRFFAKQSHTAFSFFQ
jgi:hypothetical protein